MSDSATPRTRVDVAEDRLCTASIGQPRAGPLSGIFETLAPRLPNDFRCPMRSLLWAGTWRKVLRLASCSRTRSRSSPIPGPRVVVAARTAAEAPTCKGIVTTMGSPSFRQFVPQTDAIVVERMRRSGTIIIGETNVRGRSHAIGRSGQAARSPRRALPRRPLWELNTSSVIERPRETPAAGRSRPVALSNFPVLAAP
jgi:hypothetical protein